MKILKRVQTTIYLDEDLKDTIDREGYKLVKIVNEGVRNLLLAKGVQIKIDEEVEGNA